LNDNNHLSIRSTFIIICTTFFIIILLVWFWGGYQGKSKLILFETLIIIPAIIFVFVKKASFVEVFRWKRVSMNLLFVSIFIGIGLNVITDEMDRLIQSFVPMRWEVYEAIKSQMTYQTIEQFILIFIAAAIVAPLTEEMLFRGYLQGVLEKATFARKAIIVSAFIFTFVHFNPWWTLEIFIIGILIGIIAWRSGSIFPGIIVHGINNALSIFMLNVDPSKLKWYTVNEHVSPVWILISLVFIIFGFKYIYKKTELIFT
jgi:membrane protease YdiL (CAAX protease family)